jgi:hypothetical protein
MIEERRAQARAAARARVRRQRQIGAGGLISVVLVAGLVVSGAGRSDAPAPAATNAPPKPAELPMGGRTLLPAYRVVAYYGAPQDEQLGVLGIGTPAQAARKLAAAALPYRRPGRPVQPALELITTIAAADPGSDGLYRLRQSDAVIARYLAAARRARALLVLDIQPGRAPFMDEVRAFDRYLRQPDVGLALDPEWSMRSGQVPGHVIGSTDAAVVNRVSAYLGMIVRRYDLPQKLLIVHQFTTAMVAHRPELHATPGVALVINIDGFGDRPNKIAKYRLLADRRGRWFNGLKLFYHEDVHMLQPTAVLHLRPQPDVVVYE